MRKLNIKKAVIFDMDGVLVDSEPFHMQAERKVFETLRIEVSDTLHHSFVGTSARTMWKTIIEKYNLNNETMELVRRQQKYYKEILDSLEQIEPIKGVEQLLKVLFEQDFQLAVASSSSHAQINFYLERFGFQSLFAAKISGQDVEKGKPNPDIFLKAAQTLNIAPNKCAVIEDSANGVEAVVKAGMNCIGFENPNSGKQDLSKANLIISRFQKDTFQLISSLFQQ